MEVILKMNHTDFAIIFLIIFISFVVGYDFKMNALREMQNQEELYNNIFDTAVRDALRNGLELIENKVKINEDLVLSQLFEGLNELMKIDITSFPAIIITNYDGFTIWDNGVRQKIVYYDTKTESKINLIKTAVEDAMNCSTAAKYHNLKYKISISYNNVSEWYNTISDMGFLIVFQGDTFNNDKLFNRYIVSGASFKYVGSK